MFNGFPPEMITFFKELRENNNSTWFQENKDIYEKFVKEPSQDFVLEMGEMLRRLSPDIIADPKVNRSLFRLNRDVRFSKDKRPYKTNLGIWFWEGQGKRMECSGFYFHLSPPTIMLGVGLYIFPNHILKKYRAAVVHPVMGRDLAEAVAEVEAKGYEVGVRHYKKVPGGYDAGHDNAEFLLFNGLTAHIETDIPLEFHSRDILDYSFQKFKEMDPIQKWVKQMIG